MKVLLGILGVALLLLVAAAAYMGVFASVKVQERATGPYHFVYVQEATTDFDKVGDLTEALADRLEQAGIAATRPAQVFFPAGRGIPNQIGFVVDAPVNFEILGAEAFYRAIPSQLALVAEFPFRNPASFVVGVWRVHDALRGHRESRGYPETSVMVMLDGGTLRYVQPVGG